MRSRAADLDADQERASLTMRPSNATVRDIYAAEDVAQVIRAGTGVEADSWIKTNVGPARHLAKQSTRGEWQGFGAERFLDAQRLVPFRRALGTRARADLQLTGGPSDGKVHNRDVLSFAGAR